MQKKCEECGKRINVDYGHTKYCNKCRPIVNKRRSKTYYMINREKLKERSSKYAKKANEIMTLLKIKYETRNLDKIYKNLKRDL